MGVINIERIFEHINKITEEEIREQFKKQVSIAISQQKLVILILF